MAAAGRCGSLSLAACGSIGARHLRGWLGTRQQASGLAGSKRALAYGDYRQLGADQGAARKDAVMQQVIEPETSRTEDATREPSFIARLDELLVGRRDLFLDLIRMYLGLGLIAKGIYFIIDGEFVGNLLLESRSLDIGAAFLSHYIPMAHIAGGALMLLGLATRFAAIIQLPILVGAVFFIHLREGLFTRGQSLEFTALVLFLLLVFAVVGSGRLSVDNYWRRRRGAQPPGPNYGRGI